MQLGMIGLGRMGANILRRVMRDGHTGVAYDTNADAVADAGEGRRGRRDHARGLRRRAREAARGLGDDPGRHHRQGRRAARRADGRRRHHHQRRQLELPRGRRPRRRAEAERHPLRRRRHERRRVGPRSRLLPDDRRRRRGGRSTATRCSRASPRASATSSARRGARATRRRRSRATCTAGRVGVGPLREDGPQRHRVRHDGRLRRGPQRAAPRQRRRAGRGALGRDHAAGPAAVLPVRPRHRARSPRCGGAVRSSRPGCSTSPPARCSANPQLDGLAGRVSDSGEGRWTVKAAIDEGVPVPVLSAALFARFSSRGEAIYADKLLSAMRQAFGGHVELPTGE